MLSSSTELKDIFEIAPEWKALLPNFDFDNSSTFEFLCRIGAKALYLKALSLKDNAKSFVTLMRNSYYQPYLCKMLSANQNMRRFLIQRRVSTEEQKSIVTSYSHELATKMEAHLLKQLSAKAEDGFKVLLPAYMQRSIHNAVVDYIRNETSWEKETLQDVYLDPQFDDPRTTVADDISYSPENQALSKEQVSQLNELRIHLKAMLSENDTVQDPLIVIDCMFGLGLTKHSEVGEEMTMKETCEKLNIKGETQARKIARCQVLLDKGLVMVRQRIYKQIPEVAKCWQKGLNINSASRRELAQQLSMTEGEIERLIKSRQYLELMELIEKEVLKKERIEEITNKGAIVAFVPVDINSASSRDLIDILGLSKEISQKLVSERPFKDLKEVEAKNLLNKQDIKLITIRGAVVKTNKGDAKRLDLNKAAKEDLENLGLNNKTIQLLISGRPFLSWADLEECISWQEAVGSDKEWLILRQKFFLGLSPS